jgi:predicted RND superfamily exporter protein
MRSIAGGILKFRKTVLAAFLVLSAACALMMSGVTVNFKIENYLPDSTPSTIALRKVEKSFGNDVPNMRVFVPGLTVTEALKMKERLGEINGVRSVMWLDDVIDIRVPLAMADKKTADLWYKDGTALFLLCADELSQVSAVEAVRKMIGPGGLVSGMAVNMAATRDATMAEVGKITLFVVPLGIIILMLATESWLEPLLFLAVIGVAVILNEGTNIFLGAVSYVTRATSAILQLAVSMDYAVFLSHRYSYYRKENYGDEEAMKMAIAKSFPAIAASAFTTVLGFLALTLMRFKIGSDMGFVLAKGVLFSYISVTVLLPVLFIFLTRLLDKTRHRSYMPKFGGFSRLVIKLCRPLAAVVCLFLLPAFLAQNRNNFLYGSAGMHSEDSQIMRDSEAINDVFGKNVQMVLLVSDAETAGEAELTRELLKIGSVKSVVSYSNAVGQQVPFEFLRASRLSQFRTNGYSRLILDVATDDESDAAFLAVEQIRGKAQEYFPGKNYLVGQSVVNYDLKKTISADNIRVNSAAIIAIGLVILLTFRSLSLPVLLLLTIEGAIWINMSIPYFTGSSLNYIGFQIVSAVQLGATVDYGILYSQHYLDNRKSMPKREAAELSLKDTAGSILTTASILFASGEILGLVSSNGIISELGMILGRGAAISAGMVMFFLPALLISLDKFVMKSIFEIHKLPSMHNKSKGVKERTV